MNNVSEIEWNNMSEMEFDNLLVELNVPMISFADMSAKLIKHVQKHYKMLQRKQGLVYLYKARLEQMRGENMYEDDHPDLCDVYMCNSLGRWDLRQAHEIHEKEIQLVIDKVDALNNDICYLNSEYVDYLRHHGLDLENRHYEEALYSLLHNIV